MLHGRDFDGTNAGSDSLRSCCLRVRGACADVIVFAKVRASQVHKEMRAAVTVTSDAAMPFSEPRVQTTVPLGWT